MPCFHVQPQFHASAGAHQEFCYLQRGTTASKPSLRLTLYRQPKRSILSFSHRTHHVFLYNEKRWPLRFCFGSGQDSTWTEGCLRCFLYMRLSQVKPPCRVWNLPVHFWKLLCGILPPLLKVCHLASKIVKKQFGADKVCHFFLWWKLSVQRFLISCSESYATGVNRGHAEYPHRTTDRVSIASFLFL